MPKSQALRSSLWGLNRARLLTAVIVKSNSSRALLNDRGYPELTVDFGVGGYLQSKACFVLEKRG